MHLGFTYVPLTACMQVATALDSIQVPGTFACSNPRIQLGSPLDLMVQSVGSIQLPSCLQQAGQLISAGEPAPYGKVTQTVLDPTVRRGNTGWWVWGEWVGGE